MINRVPAFAVLALVLLLPTSASTAACWAPPVDGIVVDPFREPPCPYCAGNRGIEYRVRSGSVVTAVASGSVSWSGVVAGTRYLVIRHPDGKRATYGRLATSSLAFGDSVVAGAVIGTTTRSFYFGLRFGEEYLDPTPFLGEWRGRPRLVPVDGRPPRPAPPARLRCGS